MKEKEDMVCHLHRSLYGLKQSPRCWNKELSCHLFDAGFQQSKADPCVYFQWKNGHLNIVSIYVDDLILVVDLLKYLLKMKEELSSRFKMKDLDQLRYCLGIVCEQENACIRINQRPYIDNLVKRFGLSDAFGVSTPADTCVKLVADDKVSQPADPRLCQQIVGSLQYVAGGTRPDIAYAVSTIAKFCHQPAELHMTAAKDVLRYLKQTRPKLDIRQEHSRSHHWLLRCQLGRRREGPTVNLWECVFTWRWRHHLVKQEAEFGSSVHS